MACRSAGVVIAWLLTSVTATAADSYKVVIHAASPVASLARRQVAALFLRRTTRWENGTTVLPVDGPDSSAREDFSNYVLGKRASAVRSYWMQIVFSGQGVPPPEKPSDGEVIAYVKAHPGAIGYVSAATTTTEVKVLKITVTR